MQVGQGRHEAVVKVRLQFSGDAGARELEVQAGFTSFPCSATVSPRESTHASIPLRPFALSLSEASGVERRSRMATAISKMPLKGKSVPRVLDAGSIGSDRDGSVREEATAGAPAVLGRQIRGSGSAVCTVWIRTWLSKRLCCRRCLATRRTCRPRTTHQDMTCGGSQDTSFLFRSVKTRFKTHCCGSFPAAALLTGFGGQQWGQVLVRTS